MRKMFLCLSGMLLTGLVFGQTNIPKLLEFSAKATAISKAEQTSANRFADSLGLPKRIERGNSLMELAGFNKGIPSYRATDNLIAAATTSTSAVWPGGGAGLNLTGSGITLGIWDGGICRTTHQEYGGRVMVKDGSTAVINHATHVGATMIASGVIGSVKGMSPAASLWSNDWNNDIAEMAARAAEGIQVSNHSYGYVAGWTPNYRGDGLYAWFGYEPYSTTTDYGFGAYESISHDWDLIAFNAPDYLMVKSSGNDRGEGPVDQPVSHWVFDNLLNDWVLSTTVRDKDGGNNGYDCISWQGVAKNILTVGSVNDIPDGYQQPFDVTLASTSSTGPADDGRIKPDIVANGMGLYSAISTRDNSYGTMSGTSMATPNVSGSVGLLIQHRFNLTGSTAIHSATLKGIIIHTANESGIYPGPDYKFGWGLLNTKKAALLMSEDASNGFNFNIRELTLTQGETMTIPVYTKGSEPLTATICWTDPPSTVFGQYLNDPTPMLVNDLDIRIISDSDETIFPWKLDGSNPSASATTGDNMVDNVERAEAGTPLPQKTYIVQVTHKGTLVNGSQNFSLIISGISQAPETTEWNGQESNDWNSSGNWNYGIPGAGTDVTISDVSTNIPVIHTNAWCNDLTIGPEGALTLNPQKNLTVAGNMLIQSNDLKTGSYIGSNPAIAGSLSVERYLNGYTADNKGWHLLSSPVSAQPISNFHSPGTGNDFYKWDEPDGSWINRTAVGGALNESFEADFVRGRGYLVANSADGLKNFTGSFNDGAITVQGLSRNSGTDNSGWNLVGNPFPAAVAWNDGLNWAVPAQLASVAKVWDESASSYTDIEAGEPIPSGNGFMVQLLSDGPGTLTIPLEARVHNGSGLYKSAQTRMVLTASDLDHSTSQQTVIAIREGTKETYDDKFDSHFLPGYAPAFYSITGNELLSKKTLPEIPMGKIIQLGFIKNEAENFSINLSEINLPSETQVFLIDEKEGIVQDIKQKPGYDFTAFESDNPLRFKLYFSNPGENIADEKDDFIVYPANSSLNIIPETEKNCEFRLINSSGKLILQSQTEGKSYISVNVGNYPPGFYIVSLIKDKKILNKKVIING